MRHSCSAFVCFGLLYFTASCSKENISAGDMPLVQRINGAVGDSTGSWEFFYDSTQRLQSVKFENNNRYKSDISIAGEGNDTAIVTTLNRQPWGTETVSADTLVYNNGKVVKKLSRYFSTVYVYDALGRLIADSSGSGPLRNDHTIAHDFSYDEHGNLILAHTYFTSAAVTALSETMRASYNGNQNPYYKIGALDYILCNSNLSLSRHNRTTATYENPGNPLLRTDQYSYDYNTGFLIRMSVHSTGSNVITSDFYY